MAGGRCLPGCARSQAAQEQPLGTDIDIVFWSPVWHHADSICADETGYRAMTINVGKGFGRLTREERDFWGAAYLAAFPIVLGAGQAIDRSMVGRVRAATEAAWASLDAYRRAAMGARP